MRQSWDGCARGFRFCTAALLLVISGLPLRADQIDSADVRSLTIPTSSPTDGAYASAPLPTPAVPWSGDYETRTQLTGDWDGVRDDLAENGLTFLGDITQYYQGVTSGGLARQFEYGGRGDYLIDVDSRKIGLWEDGHLDLRGETRLGQDCNGIDGAVSPSNFAMALPLPNQNVTALTGVQYTHDLSENLSIFFGKLNLLDGTPDRYARGMRLNYFWNAAMQNNLSRIFLLPSVLGGGFVLRDEIEPVFNFYLLDTHFTPTTSGFSTLFSNGVVAYGEYRLRTNWFDQPGHSAIGFLYSNATRTALDFNPYVVLPAIIAGESLPTKSTAWTVTYRFDQVLYADAEDPKRNWSLYSDIGLTDGNPNPIRWFANLSLVGTSPIRSRENDTIGIGYYHLGVSNLPILTLHGFGAEDGVELFYNAAITPWFHVTPDLQILDPAQSHTATAVLVGIRARLSF
ncbi:MAG TPA: carbohydrate porin [Planctomycetaceae bacterium]|nr:carbohydrate porin [Planctomycetaceae bacterium]